MELFQMRIIAGKRGSAEEPPNIRQHLREPTLRHERSMPSMRYRSAANVLPPSNVAASLRGSGGDSTRKLSSIDQVQEDWLRRVNEQQGMNTVFIEQGLARIRSSVISNASSFSLLSNLSEELKLCLRSTIIPMHSSDYSHHTDHCSVVPSANISANSNEPPEETPEFLVRKDLQLFPTTTKTNADQTATEDNSRRPDSDPTLSSKRAVSSVHHHERNAVLPKTNNTADLAYFLKNSNPPRTPSVPTKKSSFRDMFHKVVGGKQRERSGTNTSANSGDKPGSFPPNTIVKKTKDGKTYIAIRPDLSQPAELSDASTSFNSSVASGHISSEAPRLSVHLEEQPGLSGDPFGEWCEKEAERQYRGGFNTETAPIPAPVYRERISSRKRGMTKRNPSANSSLDKSSIKSSPLNPSSSSPSKGPDEPPLQSTANIIASDSYPSRTDSMMARLPPRVGIRRKISPGIAETASTFQGGQSPHPTVRPSTPVTEEPELSTSPAITKEEVLAAIRRRNSSSSEDSDKGPRPPLTAPLTDEEAYALQDGFDEAVWEDFERPRPLHIRKVSSPDGRAASEPNRSSAVLVTPTRELSQEDLEEDIASLLSQFPSPASSKPSNQKSVDVSTNNGDSRKASSTFSIDELVKQLRELDATISEQQNYINQQNERAEEVDSRNARLEERNVMLTEEIKSREEQVRALSVLVDGHDLQIEQMEARREVMERTIRENENAIKLKERSIKENKRVIKEMDDCLQIFKLQLPEMKGALRLFEERDVKTRETVKAFEEQDLKMKKKIQELEKQILEMEEKVQILHERDLKQANEILAQEEEIRVLNVEKKGQVQRLEQLQHDAEAKLKSQHESILDKDQIIDIYRQKNDKLCEENDRLLVVVRSFCENNPRGVVLDRIRKA